MQFTYTELDEQLVAPLITVGVTDRDDRGSMLVESFGENMARHHYLLPDSAFSESKSQLQLNMDFPNPAIEGTILHLSGNTERGSIDFCDQAGRLYCRGKYREAIFLGPQREWKQIACQGWMKFKPSLWLAERFIFQFLWCALDTSREHAQGFDFSQNQEMAAKLKRLQGPQGQKRVLGYPCKAVSLTADISKLKQDDFIGWQICADRGEHCRETGFRHYKMDFYSTHGSGYVATVEMMLARLTENEHDLSEPVEVNENLEPC